MLALTRTAVSGGRAGVRTILVTGFEPFGRDRINPSAEIARALEVEFARTEREGVRIAARVLPVSRERLFEELDRALDALRPEALVGLGLADGRSVISVETRARNFEEYSIPDNDGAQPAGEVIVADGPEALPSTLPTGALVDAIRSEGVPASESADAGAYLCNRLYYGALLRARAARSDAGFRAVFLHLPSLPECVAEAGEVRASMPLATSRRAVDAVLDYLARLPG